MRVLARFAQVEHDASARTRDIARELYRTYLSVCGHVHADEILFQYTLAPQCIKQDMQHQLYSYDVLLPQYKLASDVITTALILCKMNYHLLCIIDTYR